MRSFPNRRQPDLARRIFAAPPGIPGGPGIPGVPDRDGTAQAPGTPSIPWPHLAQAALERDMLDAVDLTLIRTVVRRAGCAGDPALQAVLGCLLSAVRGGALRIPSAPGPLTARLESFLRDLHYGPDPESPEAQTQGHAAAAAAADPAVLASAIARDFHAAWRGGAYAALLGEPTSAEEAPFTPLLHSGGGLYFQRHQAAEARAGLRLAALLAATDPALPADTVAGILDAILNRHPLRAGPGPGAAPLQFRDGQSAALSLALRKRFAVISGGPGTGKTSLVANLLRAKVRLPRDSASPLRIRLAAPTGRAAQRITESLRKSLSHIAYAGADAAEQETLDKPLAGLAGETLHRLLRYHPDSGEYFHRKDRPLPADLVIVDEVSMVDIFALARLVDALEEDASLVLLGDMDQLPSVEAGAVLADLVHAPATEPAPLRDHLVILERSHRSEAGILETARRINAMDGMGALLAMEAPVGADRAAVHPLEGPWPVSFLEDGRRVTPGGGCRMLDVLSSAGDSGRIDPAPPAPPGRHGQGGYAGLAAWIESWIGFHYLGHPQDPASHPGRILASPRRASYAALVERIAAAPADAPGTDAWNSLLDEIFAYLDQARILTFTRKGWHGSAALNARIRDKLAPLWDPYSAAQAGPGEAFHGAPVLIQENEYGKGLFNGEVGVLLRHRGRSMAWFRKEEGYRAYPAPFLPRHELAFASTVHKAQGSEYDQVLIVLPEAGNRLLYKETLYTAVTRARHFAGVYGPREVFLEAAGRRVVRESGLREFLASVSAS